LESAHTIFFGSDTFHTLSISNALHSRFRFLVFYRLTKRVYVKVVLKNKSKGA
jgi:hypothetical protein